MHTDGSRNLHGGSPRGGGGRIVSIDVPRGHGFRIETGTPGFGRPESQPGKLLPVPD